MSGIGNLPKTTIQQINTGPSKGTFWKGVIERNSSRLDTEIKKASNDPILKDLNPILQTGADQRGFFDRFLFSPFIFLLTSPVKLIASPFIESGGKKSWGIMERRTDFLFRKSIELDARNIQEDELKKILYSPNSAILPKFLNHLSNSKLDEKQDITIMAHSMGAIIANKMIRHSPQIKYKNIVYMGAAASINDFLSSIPPYLEERKENESKALKKKKVKQGKTDEENQDTKFYNLMLHPYAESGETNCFDLVPRGSLLEWLDDYFTEPRTLLDRRMGKYFNMIQALHTINPEIRNRIHLRHFDVGRKSNYPQKHGEFDDPKYRFWREEFWDEGK